MRVANDEIDFAAYLLAIQNGTVNVHSEVGEDIIQLHKDILVDTMDELINKAFPNIEIATQTSILLQDVQYSL